MHINFSRDRGDRISTLHEWEEHGPPVPAVLELLHPMDLSQYFLSFSSFSYPGQSPGCGCSGQELFSARQNPGVRPGKMKLHPVENTEWSDQSTCVHFMRCVRYILLVFFFFLFLLSRCIILILQCDRGIQYEICQDSKVFTSVTRTRLYCFEYESWSMDGFLSRSYLCPITMSLPPSLCMSLMPLCCIISVYIALDSPIYTSNSNLIKSDINRKG